MLLIFILVVVFYFTLLIKFSNSIYYDDDINLESDFFPNVSVIVSARNEQKNIKKLIDSLISQKYPINKLEILINSKPK